MVTDGIKYIEDKLRGGGNSLMQQIKINRKVRIVKKN